MEGELVAEARLDMSSMSASITSSTLVEWTDARY